MDFRDFGAERYARRALLAGLLALGVGTGGGVTSAAADAAAANCPGEIGPVATSAVLPVLAEHVRAHHPVRILAIGSSSTQGVGASSLQNSYPEQLEDHLEDLWPRSDIDVVNAGIGGETAEQTLVRFEQALAAPAKPDLVLWQVGTNDAIRGGDEARFKATLERGIGVAAAADVSLLLIDQQFFPTIKDRPRYDRYVAIVAEVAKAYAVPVFSRFALMRAWAERDAVLLTSMLSGDSFHMSDRGYACLAGALSRAIESAVAQTPVASIMWISRTKRVRPAPVVAATRRG
jgi:acyl-CoA thioesterase I